eukprot:TRINITY_DN2247_c0_g1_i3.p4 TRINITY_DN2247_c0_g1~~TRINITY_DN2247_c0_g1_i3.p4  ORF type:complete len:126 (+),score=2.57 TRINITY_DN2247_c0_g1_i3:739-1116(+)
MIGKHIYPEKTAGGFEIKGFVNQQTKAVAVSGHFFLENVPLLTLLRKCPQIKGRQIEATHYIFSGAKNQKIMHTKEVFDLQQKSRILQMLLLYMLNAINYFVQNVGMGNIWDVVVLCCEQFRSIL